MLISFYLVAKIADTDYNTYRYCLYNKSYRRLCTRVFVRYRAAGTAFDYKQRS